MFQTTKQMRYLNTDSSSGCSADSRFDAGYLVVVEKWIYTKERHELMNYPAIR